MCSGRAGDLLGRCSGGARSCSRSGAVGDELLDPSPSHLSYCSPPSLSVTTCSCRGSEPKPRLSRGYFGWKPKLQDTNSLSLNIYRYSGDYLGGIQLVMI